MATIIGASLSMINFSYLWLKKKTIKALIVGMEIRRTKEMVEKVMRWLPRGRS